MDLLSLSGVAVGYLVSKIKSSKGGKEASDEMSSAIWHWIRPIFLKDDTPIKDLKEDPDSKMNQDEVKIKIGKYLSKNEDEVEKLKSILDSEKSGTKVKGNYIDLSGAKIDSLGNVSIVGGNQTNLNTKED